MDKEKRYIPNTNPDWGLELPDGDLNSLVAKSGKNHDDGYNFDEKDEDETDRDFDSLTKETFDPESAKKARLEALQEMNASSGDIPNSEKPHTFEELNQIADKVDIPILTHLNSTNPEAKAEFLSDQTLEHPRNEWKKLRDPSFYESNITAIDNAKAEIEENTDLDPREKMLLGIEYEYARKKNKLALATAKYNSATTPEEKESARLEHQSANAELYGMPDKDTFYGLLKQKLSRIDSSTLSEDDSKQYNELTQMLGPIPENTKPLYEPNQENVDFMGNMVRDFYKSLLRHIPEDQETFTAQDAADIVNETIREEIDPNTDWHAEVIPNAGLASVSAENKIIKFPGARSKGDYNRSDLEKIIVHELGVHSLRAMPYDDSKIKVFHSGSLEGREVFEEGIAKVMEQSLEGKFDDPNSPAPSRYIMIGLANLEHTNFRQTFEIMKRLEHLTNGWNEGQIYDNLQRVYRGTGVLPNNKDLAYYDGNVKAWQFAEKDPEAFFELLLSGKINPEDPTQEYLSYEMRTGTMERED